MADTPASRLAAAIAASQAIKQAASEESQRIAAERQEAAKTAQAVQGLIPNQRAQ